jgi:hypothetical protein
MICPNCNNEQSVNEGNYGALYTCKACQAVYFIGFDGKPEFGEVENFQDASYENSSQPPTQPEGLDNLQMPSFDQPLDMSTLPPTNLPDAVAAVMDELPQTNEVAADINPMQPLAEFNENEFAVNASPFENLQPASSSTPPTTQFSEIAKEISAYGNSETQIAHLNYDLRVSGLDTVELINEFKDIINDSRFGWDMNEVMKTMKAGEIRFQQLNPVKAYILAKRLQFLNVEKIWKQNAVG